MGSSAIESVSPQRLREERNKQKIAIWRKPESQPSNPPLPSPTTPTSPPHSPTHPPHPPISSSSQHSQAFNREQHVRSAHRRERPFECSYNGCSQRFAFKASQLRHESNVHVGPPSLEPPAVSTPTSLQGDNETLWGDIAVV